MTKSKNKLEVEQASIKAVTMMREYTIPDTPTKAELEVFAAVLQTANDKYHAADTEHAGEIDPVEFLKVVQNLSGVFLELEKYDAGLAVLDDALNVTSLVGSTVLGQIEVAADPIDGLDFSALVQA